MGIKKYLLFIFIISSLSSCQMIKDKLSNHYIKEAQKIANKEEASKEEIDSIYENLNKALDYKSNLPETLNISEKIAKASVKGGYIKAFDLNINLVKKYIKLNPYYWNAYLNLISAYSIKGDILNLEQLISELSSLENSEQDKNIKLTFLILQEISYFNILPWIESQGYLSLNTNAQDLFSNLKQFSSFYEKAYLLNEKIEKEQNLFPSISKEIIYAYQISKEDSFKDLIELNRNYKINTNIENDKNFAKALKYLIDGNVYFSKQEYSNARVYYKASLNNFPDLPNTKKQIIENNFQESLKISLTQKNDIDLTESLYDNYLEIVDLIDEKPKSLVPFISNDNFYSQLYSLKAAILNAILTTSKLTNKKKRTIRLEIKQSIELAIKYNPKNKMAREIFERLNKDDNN